MSEPHYWNIDLSACTATHIMTGMLVTFVHGELPAELPPNGTLAVGPDGDIWMGTPFQVPLFSAEKQLARFCAKLLSITLTP